ncbi:hypothetical protein [Methylophaga sp. OBS4]|uniref:hypothetical protein n=1 Tax=Methylophaga sp. OBS4 TaxID=2991935 RepID=UPI00224CEA40|nr:hypothetical protein [Methylophaga sp. OBS4]MCX4187146.1 hypothetical protein [Methylophaga sp. OBS4]
MNTQQHKMEQAIQALRGAAKAIAAGIEEESINSQEVYSMLEVIADQMQHIAEQVDSPSKS